MHGSALQEVDAIDTWNTRLNVQACTDGEMGTIEVANIAALLLV